MIYAVQNNITVKGNKAKCQPFPAQNALRRLDVENVVCSNIWSLSALFVKTLYKVCMARNAESYAPGQQLSLACSGRLEPIAC